MAFVDNKGYVYSQRQNRFISNAFIVKNKTYGGTIFVGNISMPKNTVGRRFRIKIEAVKE